MNSPLSYFGGKSRVAWVFFKKPESKVEVLNDRDNNIVNLYRVIQHHPEEFLRQFKILFVSRRIFDLLKRHDDECLTDIHRAVKWFYLLKAAFGGHMVKSSFGYGTTDRARLNLLGLEETIMQIHWRLAGVTIENLPYQEIIGRYDRSHTFFYLDPPYYGFKVYRLNFECDDFERLARALRRVKGKFLMSINDHREVRRLFAGFQIRPVTLKYSASHPAAGSRKASATNS